MVATRSQVERRWSEAQPTSENRGRLFHSRVIRCRLRPRLSESVAQCLDGPCGTGASTPGFNDEHRHDANDTGLHERRREHAAVPVVVLPVHHRELNGLFSLSVVLACGRLVFSPCSLAAVTSDPEYRASAMWTRAIRLGGLSGGLDVAGRCHRPHSPATHLHHRLLLVAAH